jgi:mannose-6-phosphate isomerase-like protein (cupin superfamily)
MSVDQIATPTALEEIQQKLPGMIEVLEFDHPGMHTTDTVDFDVIISGEAYLELDDGAEVLLKAGDGVIQNGTPHAWHNRSSEKCCFIDIISNRGNTISREYQSLSRKTRMQ